MTVNDAYEFIFNNLSLTDKTGGKPMRIEGRYTGAFMIGNFSLDKIEFTDGLTSDIIKTTFDTQAW
jgi:hypothetical protein